MSKILLRLTLAGVAVGLVLQLIGIVADWRSDSRLEILQGVGGLIWAGSLLLYYCARRDKA